MKSPSCSKLQLATHCLAPWANYDKWPPSTMSEAAKLGTAWHAVAAKQIERGIHTALNTAAEYAAALEAIRMNKPTWHQKLNEMKPSLAARQLLAMYPTAEAEIGFSLDFATDKAVCLGKVKSHFELPRVNPPYVVGVVDVVVRDIDQVTGASRLVIVDWKTGHGELPTPRDSMQLLALAYAAWLVQPADIVRVEYRQVDSNGFVEIVGAELDGMELVELMAPMAVTVRSMLELKGKAVPTPGPWCSSQYCPVKGICPSITQALATVETPDAMSPVPKSTKDILGPQDAGNWLMRLQSVRTVCEHIETLLKEWATENGGIPCDGGKWGPVERSREDISGEDMFAVIMGLQIDPEDFLTAVPGTLTKTAIKAIAAKLAPARAQGAFEKELLGRLSEAGLVKTSSYVKFEVRK